MIEIKNLCKSYPQKRIYQNLNLSFKKQQTTSIMGPSGVGKTTLLRILAGLETYEQGEILGLAHQKVAYVFQEDRLMPWLTVRENIEYVLMSRFSKAQCQEKVEWILELMKLEEEINAPITSLSGGMKRRVALGRALAYEGDLLLMDEPFKGLDEALKYEILEKMKALFNMKQTTVICTTHDLEEAKLLGEVINLGHLNNGNMK